MSSKVVLLLGAGHAHLHLASRALDYRKLGAQLILADPGQFWYSGMATGMLSGQYSPKEDQIDAESLVHSCGGTFLRKRAVKVSPLEKVVEFEDGYRQNYDLLSVNVGSEVSSRLGGSAEGIWPVKPIADLSSLRGRIEEHTRRIGRFPKLCVVGGGPTGSEICASLVGLAGRLDVLPDVTLLAAEDRLINPHPQSAADFMLNFLRKRGVRVEFGTRIDRRDGKSLLATDGRRYVFDHAVIATGLTANALVREMGLAFDEADGLRVASTLQSIENPSVFAVGDCASFMLRKLAKIGVYGVRAAPVLHANLMSAISGQDLRHYQPQRRYLSVLNLGNDSGLASWGDWWFEGKSMLWLKDFIDRRFLDRYRQLIQNDQH